MLYCPCQGALACSIFQKEWGLSLTFFVLFGSLYITIKGLFFSLGPFLSDAVMCQKWLSLLLAPLASIIRKCLFFQKRLQEFRFRWLQSLSKDLTGKTDFQQYDKMDPRSWCNTWKFSISPWCKQYVLCRGSVLVVLFMIWFLILLNGWLDANLFNLQIVWFLHFYVLQWQNQRNCVVCLIWLEVCSSIFLW
jgi:hypothetical protein